MGRHKLRISTNLCTDTIEPVSRQSCGSQIETQNMEIQSNEIRVEALISILLRWHDLKQ